MADFLRHHREALQPEDVGLSRGARRRTRGLRREEVASLSDMSTDYYSRLEQRRGPQPSEQMLAAIAGGLRLTADERDHLFRLAGHSVPARSLGSSHVSPVLIHVLDRLDTPAQVVSYLGDTLAQNSLSVALVGDQMKYSGLARSILYRWFLDPSERQIYLPEDHDHQGRAHAAHLRGVLAREQDVDTRAQSIFNELSAKSPEFARVWDDHEVAIRVNGEAKRFIHPSIGLITFDFQALVAEGQAQALLVYTAKPGTEDSKKLELLSVIATRTSATAAKPSDTRGVQLRS